MKATKVTIFTCAAIVVIAYLVSVIAQIVAIIQWFINGEMYNYVAYSMLCNIICIPAIYLLAKINREIDEHEA